MAYNDGFATAWYPKREAVPIFTAEPGGGSGKKKCILLIVCTLVVLAIISTIVACVLLLKPKPAAPATPAPTPRSYSPLTSMEIEGDITLLGQNYTDSMNQSGTPEYKDLSDDVCKTLVEKSDGNGLVNASNCDVTNVRPGSIRVHYRMRFVKFEGVQVSDEDCMKKVGRHTTNGMKKHGHMKHGFVYPKSCRFQSNGACKPNPCKNGGKCVNNGDSYECLCKKGHGGKKCDTKPKFCHCSGDPHCKTFDHAKMDFQSTCRYTLLQADDESFKISGRNIRRQGKPKVAFARWIEIKSNGVKVRLGKLNKKEKSTDCDSALIPLLCVHG